MEIVISKNNVPIRLTDERWEHITKSHDYMAPYFFDILEALADPELIVKGKSGELIAAKKLIGAKKYIVVVYKESGSSDGFIITAFLTKKVNQIKRRKILWPKS